MVSSKVAWRNAAQNVENLSDNWGRMGATTKAAPAGGGTPDESLTAAPEMEVAAVAHTTKERVLADLARAQIDYEEARLRQARAVLFAREAGLSNRAIGQVLGITEGAVRYIVKKLGGGDGTS